MSGVDDPLDIAFFDADGLPDLRPLDGAVSRQGETECPAYRADGPYQYAVETLKGQLPSGSVTAC